MQIIHLISLVLCMVIFTNCDHDKKKSKEEQRQELRSIERQRVQSMLTQKYDVYCSLDTCDLFYSIDFQNLIDDSSYILIKNFKITDLYKTGDQYYISTFNEYFAKSTFEGLSLNLLVSPVVFNEINLASKSNRSAFRYFADAAMVVRLNSVKKTQKTISDHFYLDGGDLDLEDGKIYVCEGEVIDFQLYQFEPLLKE